MNNELKQKIDNIIRENSVVLFMKGTKERPQCGFSKRVVDVLKKLSNDFKTIDVLQDPALREGIKTYSSWPTIPQLYVDGEFIGGCDIVVDMFNKHELSALLKVRKAAMKPEILLSEKAREAFRNACADAQDGECIRLSIDVDFEHGLTFGERNQDDFIFHFGDVVIAMDPYSAARASGLNIDYVSEDLDAGFSFTNPNEPPAVKKLTVEEFKTWHDEGKNALLIDVRPRHEWALAHIASAQLLDEMNEEAFSLLSRHQVIVFHCHHGNRSKRVAESFRARGFTNLYNLEGGIDAWSRRIDPAIPTYTK